MTKCSVFIFFIFFGKLICNNIWYVPSFPLLIKAIRKIMPFIWVPRVALLEGFYCSSIINSNQTVSLFVFSSYSSTCTSSSSSSFSSFSSASSSSSYISIFLDLSIHCFLDYSVKKRLKVTWKLFEKFDFQYHMTVI